MILLHRVAAWLEIKAECWPKLAELPRDAVRAVFTVHGWFIHFEHLCIVNIISFFP